MASYLIGGNPLEGTSTNAYISWINDFVGSIHIYLERVGADESISRWPLLDVIEKSVLSQSPSRVIELTSQFKKAREVCKVDFYTSARPKVCVSWANLSNKRDRTLERLRKLLGAL